MTRKGLFISFEGIDGSGKTTQARLLADYLRDRGVMFMLVRDPGSTDVAEKIRELLKSALWQVQRESTAELFLYLAARAHLMQTKIIPALEHDYVVISDRFSDSTLVYQGISLNIGLSAMEKIAGMASTAPDLTFLLDIDPALAAHRSRSGKDTDCWDDAGFELMGKLRTRYLEVASRYPQRIVVLDGAEATERISERVLSIVRAGYLPQLRGDYNERH